MLYLTPFARNNSSREFGKAFAAVLHRNISWHVLHQMRQGSDISDTKAQRKIAKHRRIIG